MKKAFIISALAIFVILGGVFLFRGMDQQGDIALKDNFTSSFILLIHYCVTPDK